MAQPHMTFRDAAAEIDRLLHRIAIAGGDRVPGPHTRDLGADELRRAARRLHQIGEWRCNGYPYPGTLTEGAALKLDRFEAKAMDRARAGLALALGDHVAKVALHHQGDPRGASLVVTRAGECDQGGNRVATFW